MYHEKKIREGDDSVSLGVGEGTPILENMAGEEVTETVTFEWRPKVSEGVGQADTLREE